MKNHLFEQEGCAPAGSDEEAEEEVAEEEEATEEGEEEDEHARLGRVVFMRSDSNPTGEHCAAMVVDGADGDDAAEGGADDEDEFLTF